MAALVMVLLAALQMNGCSLIPLDSLIFFPDPDVPATPPPGVEERWITTEDGVRLHAWYVAPRGAAPTLVWSHGNGGNIAGRAEVLVALAARGLGVLAYDYRGYGRSAGAPSEEGVYLDVRAAYESERAAAVPPGRLIAFGESLGSAVAVHLASERRVAGLVLVSPFTTLAEVAERHYGPLAFLATGRFNALALIGTLTVPVFIAHGDRDEIVPFELGERLFKAAREPKRFFRAEGAHHNDVFGTPGLIDAIAAFARDVAAGASAK